MGCDRDTIVKSLYQGTAQVVNAPFNAPWVPLDKVEPFKYNPDKAKSLLKDAGWDASKSVEIAAYYTDQFTGKLLAAFQQYLGDVGIKTTVKQTDFSNIEADVNAGKFGPIPED